MRVQTFKFRRQHEYYSYGKRHVDTLLSNTKTEYTVERRGLVSVGAVGVAAPTDFRKTDFAPTYIFENLTFDPSFLV